MRRAGAISVLVVAIGFTRCTWASTSGPDIAHVLGLDPRTHLVYAEIVHVDESGDLNTIVTLDLSKRGGQLPRKVEGGPAPREIGAWGRADSLQMQRIESLKRQLTPPRCASGEAFRDYQVTAADSVQVAGAMFPRFRIRVPGSLAWDKGELDLTVYKRPVVAFGSYYSFPGEARSVAILSYFPLAPSDCTCETQVPILLPHGDDPPLVFDGMSPR
jgi:hypothetical protein